MGTDRARRVVVTGVGAVTPLGSDSESTWAAALAGRSAIGEISVFDATTFPCRIAGEVKGFENVLESADTRELNRGAQFGLAAAAMAARNSKEDGWPTDRSRIGVSVGCGRPGPSLQALGCLAQGHGDRLAEVMGSSAIRGRSFEAGADIMARRLDARGPTYNVYTACSSGVQAIGQAVRCIEEGDADVMIAGGYDSMVNELSLIGFALLRVLSSSNATPESACRPFDRDRNGLVLGEGAGILILEELESAGRRGADILAEVTGYGASMSAYRITDPDPEAEGPVRAMASRCPSGMATR